MGCDIHGWIEVNRFPTQHDPDSAFAWVSAVDLSQVLKRSYAAFGRLAHDGRRQKPGDTAPFAGRGLPDVENLGESARRDYERWEADAHHESHFTHAELTQTYVQVTVGGETQAFTPIDYIRDGIVEAYTSKEAVEDSHYNHRMAYGRTRRAWEAAFDTSRALAEANGHEQVRWIVWFDN